jgi:hypothetical protein
MTVFLKNNIDNINSILIIIAFGLSIILPFELFLFAYAVLGPIHYLSEIAWLEKKNFFLPNKFYQFFFIGLSTLTSLLLLISYFNENFLALDFQQIHLEKFISPLIFLTFIGALILLNYRNQINLFLLFFLTILLAFIFHGSFFFEVFFGIFLTSLIHVWLFTAIFMINGAISSKSKYGIITFAIFLICSLAIFFIKNHHYEISQFKSEIFNLTNTVPLNKFITDLFSIKERNSLGVNNNLQSFISFAYTYHYLNWFSKTKVIKWHILPRKKLIIVFGFYLIVLSFYLTDYRLGFLVTIFLSMIHVFLEFPLNFLSFKQLFNSLNPVKSRQ